MRSRDFLMVYTTFWGVVVEKILNITRFLLLQELIRRPLIVDQDDI